jgi:SAM-dependent methyltransferase
VIHHSPRPEAIVAEMHRVLRPGGTFTVMLYNRTSINYYVEIMFLRRLFRYLLYPKFMPGLLARVTGIDQWKLEGHRARLSTKMTKEEWISINTDGPFCPLAKVYDKKEASDLFHAFADVRQEVWEFNTDHWLFIGRMMPISVAQAIGRQWGWNRVIYGRRQALKS